MSNLLLEDNNYRNAVLEALNFIECESGAKTFKQFRDMYPEVAASLRYIRNNRADAQPGLFLLYRLAHAFQLEFIIDAYSVEVAPSYKATVKLTKHQLATQWLNICIDTSNRGLITIKHTELDTLYRPGCSYNWGLPINTLVHCMQPPKPPISRTMLSLLTAVPNGVKLHVNGFGVRMEGLERFPVLPENVARFYKHCGTCGVLRPDFEFRGEYICKYCHNKSTSKWKRNNKNRNAALNNKHNYRQKQNRVELKQKLGGNVLKGLALKLRELKDGE